MIDAVIIYRMDGGDELPYCVNALRKHAQGLGSIYVIGDKPGLDGVTHIPFGDPNKRNVEANMIRKVLLACDLSNISNPFLLCANDEIFIRDVDLRSYPLYSMAKVPAKSVHGNRVKNTMSAMKSVGLPWRYYDGHVPVLIRKEVYKKAMSMVDWDTDMGPGILCRTPYGCLLESQGVKSVEVLDPKSHKRPTDAPVVSRVPIDQTLMPVVHRDKVNPLMGKTLRRIIA